MKHLAGVVLCLSAAAGITFAQSQKTASASASEAAKKPYFIHPDTLPLASIIPPPPAADSEIAKREFLDLHKIQDTRTPEQVRAAQADDAEEDIFVYRNVMGEGFDAKSLPLTAALSAHVHNDEPVAGNPLKQLFERPRPYQIDSGLHPVCKTTTQHNAYPSGHTISGYLLAFTLIQIAPEKKEEILARAQDYARNRIVCGVHTASDLEASLLVAYTVFGSLMQEPKFQQELAAARAETRRALHM